MNVFVCVYARSEKAMQSEQRNRHFGYKNWKSTKANEQKNISTNGCTKNNAKKLLYKYKQNIFLQVKGVQI